MADAVNSAGEAAARSGQAAQILELAGEARPFHTPDKIAYAEVPLPGGGWQAMPILSGQFRSWLTHRLFVKTNAPAGSEPLDRAIRSLEAKALHGAGEREVALRVATGRQAAYVDLGDPSKERVEIRSTGWRLVHDGPTAFERPLAQRPLPAPVSGGSIDLLRPFLNLPNEGSFVLVVAWLLAALRADGPYPVLVVSGEQGSAKSTLCRILRRLIDPQRGGERALPPTERDLYIGARNAHLLTYDNVTRISGPMSDCLCRLATGGGFATRALYSNDAEFMVDLARPVLINGIADVVERADLADRSIFLHLPAIPADLRRTEDEIWTEFEAALPSILGALFDGVAMGLRRLPSVRLDNAPRMADFARWATACETAYWPAGTVMRAYTANRAEARDSLLDDNPVAAAALDFAASNAPWQGTATTLFEEFYPRLLNFGHRATDIPKSPRALSQFMSRLAPLLRERGVTFDRGRDAGGRFLTLRMEPGPVPAPQRLG